MSTFNAPSTVAAATLARSSSINDLEAATAAGFGLLPDETLLKQGKVTYAVDTGAANAYVVSLPVSPAAYADGLTLSFRAIYSNTGASTINVNSLGAVSILRNDGSALQANDILAGQIVTLNYSTVTGAFQSGANSATNSQASATAAQAAAAQAAVYAAALSGTSSSSYTIATGVHTFACSTGKQWSNGQYVVFSSASNGSNYLHGRVFSYNSTTGSMSLTILDVGGSGTVSDWNISVSGTQGPVQTMAYTPRTSNTMLSAADFAGATRLMVDATSGTWTQTFDAAATIGSGVSLYFRNSGTGYITLDPNGSETIDGLTSYIMYPGEVRLIHCDGIAFRSFVIQGFSYTTQTSETFSLPPGYKTIGVRTVGGGGSGGSGGGGGSGSGSATGAGGGGGGGSSGGTGTIEEKRIDTSIMSATDAIVIGAGGTAAAGVSGGVGVSSVTANGSDGTAGNTGNAGGTTTFASGKVYAVAAVGGTAGGKGALGNRGVNTGSGAASAASTATAAAGTSALTAPQSLDWAGLAGVTGSTGSAGVSSTSGGKGGDGAASSAALLTLTTVAGGVGGATQTSAAPAAGNSGSIGTTGGSAGQGGSGSGGGSGSMGGNGGAASGNGGASLASGAGAPGQCTVWGAV
jgi:hypothetical protein